MEQKPGGGLRMFATMRDEDHSWLDNFSKNAEQSTAEAEERQRKQEASDRAFFVKRRADQARMDREYAPKIKQVQRNLQTSPDEIPVSKEKWAEIKRRSGKPAMWPEMTSLARIRVEEEAEAPINPGIFGLGLLGTVRKLFWYEIEQIHKETEANRLLHRAAIY